MTNNVGSVSSCSTQLRVGVLRWELKNELHEIGEKISSLNLDDWMSNQISEWQKGFLKALDDYEDEEYVCGRYISTLQKLLRDSITYAPLDCFAVLGTDGHTYSKMSLLVFLKGVDPEYRNRSPFDLSNENQQPFDYHPHPLVRYMVRWLESHGVDSHSEEYQRFFLNLLAQNPHLNTENKIERILQEKKERDQKANELREKKYQDFHKTVRNHKVKVARRFEKNKARLEKMEKECFSRMEEAVKEEDENLGVKSEEAREQLNQRAEQAAKSSEEIHTRLNEMADPYHNESERLQTEAETERADEERLNKTIEECFQNNLGHVEEKFQESTATTEEKIKKVAEEQQANLNQFNEDVEKTQKKMDDLQQKITELDKSEDDVARKIIRAKEDQDKMDKEIKKTEEAIEDMKRRKRIALLINIGILATSILGTWILKAYDIPIILAPKYG